MSHEASGPHFAGAWRQAPRSCEKQLEDAPKRLLLVEAAVCVVEKMYGCSSPSGAL